MVIGLLMFGSVAYIGFKLARSGLEFQEIIVAGAAYGLLMGVLPSIFFVLVFLSPGSPFSDSPPTLTTLITVMFIPLNLFFGTFWGLGLALVGGIAGRNRP
ncbi:MAG: hypothetical protein GF416_05045 [Candidatus Altiarchaeales archaeon]|nr:hypothetical protein [Candidatus Altiarchaeales archaeon]